MNQIQKNNQINNCYLSTDYFTIILDSRNATEYFNDTMNSNLIFNFEEGIRMPHKAVSLSISVLNFTSPISFYQINSTNNKISINGNIIIIPDGNYNVITFMNYFNSISPTIQLSINYNNSKFTLTSSSNFTINKSSTLYNVMGFKENTIYTSILSNSNYIINLPFCCNFSGINSFNIKINNISTRNINSFDNCLSSIIASIPINGQQNNMIYYNKIQDFEFSVNSNVLDYFDISIQDDLDNYIDFNNQNWNMTILFKVVYNNVIENKKNFYDIIENEFSHPSLEI
jgi:hypothetical protein